MGVSLLLQKRLASSVLKCGKRKIWLDPNEVNEISMANSSALPTFPARLRPAIGAVCCGRRAGRPPARAAASRRPPAPPPVCPASTSGAPCAPAAGLLACGSPAARALVANPPSAVSLSGQNIRKLVKDGFVLAKPQKVHSRARTNAYAEAKRKGRHTGHGKRKGAKEGRMPVKVLWIRRMRVLRRLLKKYREQKKVRSMPTPGKGGGGRGFGGGEVGGW